VPRKLWARRHRILEFLECIRPLSENSYRPTLDGPPQPQFQQFYLRCDRPDLESGTGRFFFGRAILTIVKRSDQAAVRLCRIVAG
jgi:hypothetical protein